MADNNTGAALAAIANNDKAYKEKALETFQDARAFYSDFAATWDDIMPRVGDDIHNIEYYTENGFDKLAEAARDIWQVLVTDIGVSLHAIAMTTDYMYKHMTGRWLEVFTGAQTEVAEKTDEQRNVVETCVGELPKIEACITEASAEVVQGTKAAMIDAQKLAAKEAKHASFQNVLGGKKEQVAAPKSKWTTAKEKAGKAKDNTKAIIGGLGKILKAILNPVALIAAFFAKFLPYVLIFGAMLYGAWQGLSDELKEKIGGWIENVVGVVLIALVGWKLLPVIIQGLALVYQVMRIAFLTTEHTHNMAVTTEESVMNKSAHSFKLLSIVKDFVLRLIEFARKIIATIIDIVLRGIEFALRVAAVAIAIVLIAAVIVLILAGILLIFKMLVDIALDVIVKIIGIAVTIIKAITDVLLTVGKMYFSGIAMIIKAIFSGIFGGISGKAKDDDDEEKKEELETMRLKNSVTASIFDDGIRTITEPLVEIKKVLESMRDLESLIEKNTSMFGFGYMNGYSGGPLARVFNRWGSNTVSMETDDSVSSNVNSSVNTATNSVDTTKMESALKDISENIKIIIKNQIASVTNGTLHNPGK